MSERFLEALAGTKVYPLTDQIISGVSHAEQVAQLSEVGATLIQLREKHLSSLEFYNERPRPFVRPRRESLLILMIVDLARWR